MSKPNGYSRLQIRLHWLIFGLIALQYILGDFMEEAWQVFAKGGTIEFSPLIAAHVFGGMLILLLVLLRLVVRFKHGVPAAPEGDKPAQTMMAHLLHWGLYLLMILMPVSGALAWFGGIEQAAQNHLIMKVALMVLIVLHVAAALYHQFVVKDNLIDRMRTPRD